METTNLSLRFPLFHQPTLLRNVCEQNYLRDRGCFASIMGVCALASARQRDGALHTTGKDSLHMVPITSETFYAAVVDTLPKDLTMARGFEFLRACALLCITSIQYGDIRAMQLYLGYYFTLVGINSFQDENCWPKNISNIEKEERRRLVISLPLGRQQILILPVVLVNLYARHLCFHCLEWRCSFLQHECSCSLPK
jgi:hypothetical protein